MSKHTPGPWSTRGPGLSGFARESGWAVAIAKFAQAWPVPTSDGYQYTEDEMRANVKLITSAPDMAATLELIVRFCETHQDGADLKWIHDTALAQLIRSLGER